MNSTKKNDVIERIRLANFLADTPQQFADAFVQLIPDRNDEDLPPISDELETQLWCHVEGLLTPDEEESLLRTLQTDPAGFAHLEHIARSLMAARVAEGLNEAQPAASTASESPDESRVVVMLARDSLRWGGAGKQLEAWRFTLARSGDRERRTTLDEERNTRLGVIRLTIDLNSDGTCQVTFHLKEPKQPTERLTAQWCDTAEHVISLQTPQKDAVRFTSVPPGLHHFVFLSDGAERERIILEICDEG